MLTEQRHDIILNLLKERGSITVSELTEELGISESTARRDLTELDRQKKLTKVFGGAVLYGNNTITTTKELSVSQKADVNLSEKKEIAKYAASIIEANDFIYLDAGTTSECMIDYLEVPDITVVTNAVSHARKLADKQIKVIILGGELKGTTEAIIGSQAVLSLTQYHFTKGFFGTNGIHKRHGYTTPDNSEAIIKKVALEHCHERYILADHDKMDKVSPIAFADFKDAMIITDSGVDASYKALDNVIICNPED